MYHEIKTYPVRHPLLRKNVRFFWEIRAEYMQLNHKLIPQRDINMRFNLGETKQFVHLNGTDYLLEDIWFSGLQDHYLNAHLKLSGKAHIFGICFYPDGFIFCKDGDVFSNPNHASELVLQGIAGGVQLILN